MKKVITIIGYPGAGKTTLSKFLAKKLHYNHFEFDKNNVLDINNDRVIFDALFLNTHGLYLHLQEMTKYGYDITVIYLNIPKEICDSNVILRGRETIDTNNLSISYNWNYLKRKFNFRLITLNHYINETLIIKELLNGN